MNLFRKIWHSYIRFSDQRKVDKEVKQKYHLNKHVKNVVIFGTPNHGNLGDFAIGYAEKKLFKNYLKDSHIIDINMAVFNREIGSLVKLLNRDDLLVLTGGGNLGNEYMDDEEIRRKVITLFPRNRITLFPQTMFFTNNKEGDLQKKKTQSIYNNHKYLTLVARDIISYQEMERLFNTKIVMLPDVVLTLHFINKNKRKGALLVLRNDIEKDTNNLSADDIGKTLDDLSIPHTLTDTEVGPEINIGEFENTFLKKINEFQSSELVITDRLHGMVFAAITETPCIVFNNYNHKVREAYRFLEGQNYIKLFNEKQILTDEIKSLLQSSQCHYDRTNIDNSYDQFMRSIIQEL